MPRGHAYLRAVMDWNSRKVLGWALSNTMGTDLCLEALTMALDATGKVPKLLQPPRRGEFGLPPLQAPHSTLAAQIRVPRHFTLDPVFTIFYQSAASLHHSLV
jgi:transposase InsO family protein